jgi:threonine/homoserine/homoserine lactone efflux protein
MDFTPWLSLATLCLLGAMTPGPSFAIVLKHTISYGRVHGVITGVAHGLGVTIYAIFAVMGIAILIKETPWLFNVIQYTGAIFLLWLAYKAFTSTPSFSQIKTTNNKISLSKSAVEGFMVAFLNPKLAIFFVALFSQFVNSDATRLHNTMLVVTVGAIDTFWYSLIALLLSQDRFIEKLRKNIYWVEKATGVALVAVSARVLL